GREPGDLFAPEADGPRCGRERPGDAVEERGLAGAVGPDQAKDLALPDLEGDVVEGGKAPNCFASKETVSTRPTNWAPGGHPTPPRARSLWAGVTAAPAATTAEGARPA